MFCDGTRYGVHYFQSESGIFNFPDKNGLPCWCAPYAGAAYPCWSNGHNTSSSRLRCDDNPRRLVGGACPVHKCLVPTPADVRSTDDQQHRRHHQRND